MKGKGRRFLCSFVALIMVMASAGTAFAAGNDVKTAGSADTVLSIVQESVENAQLQASGSFVVSTLTSVSEAEIAGMQGSLITYGTSDVVADGKMGYAQPYTFPNKGLVVMGVAAEGVTASGTAATNGYVDFGIYTDASLTNPVDYDGYASLGSTEGEYQVIAIPAARTYYIGTSSPIYTSNTSAQTYKVGTAIGYIDGGDRTLVNNKWTAVGVADTGLTYFKFKATKNGYVTVSSENLYGYVTLTNANKKAISNEVYVSDSYPETVFGVKKGKTYYLAVRSNSIDDIYRLKYKQTAITEKSGAKKAKAVTIKRGKTVKGTIAAGEGKADWYKFKLTKSKKVTLTVGGNTNDQLKISVYKGSQQIGSDAYLNKDEGTFKLHSVNQFGASSKFDKGTYYIKVTRGDNKSSGYYTLKWK